MPVDEFAADLALDYRDPGSWLHHDSVRGSYDDPVVFYVHPTTAQGPVWFDDLTDPATAAQTLRISDRQLAAFPGRWWAPRYRQATTRAFYERGGEGIDAYDLAYLDVSAAFAAFLERDAAHPGPVRPIVLAGHSQGARHVLSLVEEYFSTTGLAERLVAVYAIGIPLPADNLVLSMFPPPADPQAAGVTIGWRSVLPGYPRASPDDRISVCVNPLTGTTTRPEAEAGAHVPVDDPSCVLRAVRVAARSRGGVLEVEPTDAGALDCVVLPEGNLHRVDIELFAGNIRDDLRRRTAAWRRRTAVSPTEQEGGR
ncbi:DUF3089 domain-containing protein [Rhodococcus sp. NPDC047139]|uniref:DUF3089 domain-containing protein n=1 Tax=Rhodococcus sp. NPDC047139 TaxID=3155141 RepID=UPI0033E443E8